MAQGAEGHGGGVKSNHKRQGRETARNWITCNIIWAAGLSWTWSILAFSVILIGIYPLMLKPIYMRFSFLCNQKKLSWQSKKRTAFLMRPGLGKLSGTETALSHFISWQQAAPARVLSTQSARFLRLLLSHSTCPRGFAFPCVSRPPGLHLSSRLTSSISLSGLGLSVPLS